MSLSPSKSSLPEKATSKSGGELSNRLSFLNLKRLASGNSLSESRMDSINNSIANVIVSESELEPEAPDFMPDSVFRSDNGLSVQAIDIEIGKADIEFRKSVATTLSSNDNGGGLASTRNIKSITSITEESFSPSMDLLSDDCQFEKKFSRSTAHLTCIIMNEHNDVLLYHKHLYPIMRISELDNEDLPNFNRKHPAFIWAKYTSIDWQQGSDELEKIGSLFSESIIENMIFKVGNEKHYREFKTGFLCAVLYMTKLLKLTNFGVMHISPLMVRHGKAATLIQLIRVTKDSITKETLKENRLSWSSFKNLDQKMFAGFSTETNVWIDPMVHYYRGNRILKSGIYLGVFYCHNTLERMSILTQKHTNSLIPVVKVRSGMSISKGDSQALASAMNGDLSENNFVIDMNIALTSMSKEVGIPIHFADFISATPFHLENNVTLFVCVKPIQALGSKPETYDTKLFDLVPFTIFEALSLSIYESIQYRKRRISSLSDEVEEKDKSIDRDQFWTRKCMQCAVQRGSSANSQ